MLHKSLARALISHIAHPATALMFHYCSLLGEILKAECQTLQVNPNHCKIMIWRWGGRGWNIDETRLLGDAMLAMLESWRIVASVYMYQGIFVSSCRSFLADI